MNALFAQLLPLLYGVSFLILLWQAFKVLGRGFRAVPGLGDPDRSVPDLQNDRTGLVTNHPELLDADGQLTEEELLTVRFGGEASPPR